MKDCIKYLKKQRKGKHTRVLILEKIPEDLNVKDTIGYIKERVLDYDLVIVHKKRKDLFPELEPKYHSIVFFYDELLACPFDNVLVPVHRLLTPDETKFVLDKYSIRLDQLPKLLTSDPIARWNAWTSGNVVEIARKDGTRYYRLLT